MSKRTAIKELTHENWETEEEHEEMGTFRQASAEQLAGRNIKKAKRRGTNGDSDSPSVFKGLSVFSGFGATSETQPKFSFLSSVSKDGSEMGKVNSPSAKSEKSNSEKTSTPPLKVTQDSISSSGSKGAESKSNGFMESKAPLDVEGKSDGFLTLKPLNEKSDAFLTNLKALNEGVVVWIQKHLDKNPLVNLSPVFDDYKKHFSELVKKYPPESDSEKDSEVGAPANNSRKDLASGKENTPLLQDVSKENTTVKPFSFGIEKNSETSKTPFSFGSSSSETEKKTVSASTPAFTFTGFNSSKPKTEGSLFGNTNSTGLVFGGLKSSQAASKGSSGGGGEFSFSSSKTGSSAAASVVTEKNESVKSDEPTDEPPKVEVNEVKEEDAKYEKKCKLFYMKGGDYVDRGVGTLYLKDAGEKTQLLIRAFTNLGNILLNIVLNSSIPAIRAGKNGVIIVCVPNPPLESNAEKSKEPVKMLIRVKTSEDADTLLEKINEYKE